MSESIIVTGETKEDRYASLIPQIKALAEDSAGQWAVLGNIMSALKYGMNFFWVGLYIVKDKELILGPFQGTVACTRIGFGKGVCGTAWQKKEVIIVDDVNSFPGHIACSSESKSEIVLPVLDTNGNVKMVLDVDSEHVAHFTQGDKVWLKQVVQIIEKVVNA